MIREWVIREWVGNADIMERIVDIQRKYFETGATRPYGVRRDALLNLRKGVLKHQENLQAALKKDLGRSYSESYMAEIGQVLSTIDHTLRHLKKWMRPKHVSASLANFPARPKIVSEPYGVVLVISPWNYPVNLTLMPLVGALAAGNCCVIKPSELSPATSVALTVMIEELFPKELVCVVNGGIEVSQTVLDLHFDYIFYTGGTAVGKVVMEKASRHLTPVTLELGGKSPVIVTKSAPLRLTARRIVFGKCLNAGQTCVSPDYILVEECVHDELISMMKEEIASMYGEEPLDNPDYGKIINRRHFDRVCGLINPEKVVFGGKTDPDTLRISPTILDGVSPEDSVMKEEIFGPVLPVITVRDVDEAYAFVQQRPHPLALYLFTKDRSVEKRVMEGLQFGGGCVNDVLMHVAAHNLPFGGVGYSRMGEYHGIDTFLTFSHRKSILARGTWLDPSLRYQPYTRWKDKLVEWFS